MDSDRQYAVASLLFDYMKSPSLRHLRESLLALKRNPTSSPARKFDEPLNQLPCRNYTAQTRLGFLCEDKKLPNSE